MNFNHLENSKQSFIQIANEQERKGVQKYGKPLNPFDNYNWRTMAKEELADGYKYIEAEEKFCCFIANKVRKLTDDPEIEHWMDKLEGK